MVVEEEKGKENMNTNKEQVWTHLLVRDEIFLDKLITLIGDIHKCLWDVNDHSSEQAY